MGSDEPIYYCRDAGGKALCVAVGFRPPAWFASRQLDTAQHLRQDGRDVLYVAGLITRFNRYCQVHGHGDLPREEPRGPAAGNSRDQCTSVNYYAPSWASSIGFLPVVLVCLSQQDRRERPTWWAMAPSRFWTRGLNLCVYHGNRYWGDSCLLAEAMVPAAGQSIGTEKLQRGGGRQHVGW